MARAVKPRPTAEQAAAIQAKTDAGHEAVRQLAARLHELGYFLPDDDEPRVLVPASLLADLAHALDAHTAKEA